MNCMCTGNDINTLRLLDHHNDDLLYSSFLPISQILPSLCLCLEHPDFENKANTSAFSLESLARETILEKAHTSTRALNCTAEQRKETTYPKASPVL